jgi:superfamily II DNA or RNA helicase/HKD family nuclease
VDLPPGAYEAVVTGELLDAMSSLRSELLSTQLLDPGDADLHLARYMARFIASALRHKRGDSRVSVESQVTLANSVIDAIRSQLGDVILENEYIANPASLLLAVMAQPEAPIALEPPPRPATPLVLGALLANGRNQPRIGSEVANELATADQVDLLCSFVKWHGYRTLAQPLQEFLERGGSLRLITTTYMGATDRRALDELVRIGAQVKVSYDTRTTRLHAKAWIFRRASGFSTAYVGSSNLSRAALLDGLEWNLRVSGYEQPYILEALVGTFETYWGDPSFESYLPERDATRFDQAVASEHSPASGAPIEITALDVHPLEYQREVLERLDAERQLHDRWRNLVVMATGTGKTVVSALDYQRLRQAGKVDSLLFVAHREELLQQSLHTFRAVMKDGAFGDLLVGGRRPTEWRHLFASVQSLARVDLQELAPNAFTMVVVDEFHHAEAATYSRLLDHVQPQVLLGLTATPERADGKDVLHWFGGRIAAELRLWEALDRGLLCPFQYFGVADDVDLSHVRWRRGAYDRTELSNLYTVDTFRVQKVVRALRDKVTDTKLMRCIGFCVSIEHAEFMAQRFNLSGISARSVSASSTREEREAVLRDLKSRKINAIFAVDLFNEGIDIPEIDTVLFLRPTESATVFLQQLGRGLRRTDQKDCLTVLDFIGNQNANFRFDLRFRALTGVDRRELPEALATGFPYLPAGCHLELDKVARDVVLDNVKQGIRPSTAALVTRLREFGDHPLREFLAETGFEVEDVYRRGLSWLDVRRQAGFSVDIPIPEDGALARAFARLLHIDDEIRLNFFREVLSADVPSAAQPTVRRERLLAMLHFLLWGSNRPLAGSPRLDPLWRSARRDELLELIDLLSTRTSRVTFPVVSESTPLSVHATYTRDEALAAFGELNPGTSREGVRYLPPEQADVLFVTLRKTEGHFSPTTMYEDLAITPSLFQWETQGRTSVTSPTGQRYLGLGAESSTIHLFIRESRQGVAGASPYLYAGVVTHHSHSRDRPIRIEWRLERDLPADWFQLAATA